jgi:hypothetical protein
MSHPLHPFHPTSPHFAPHHIYNPPSIHPPSPEAGDGNDDQGGLQQTQKADEEMAEAKVDDLKALSLPPPHPPVKMTMHVARNMLLATTVMAIMVLMMMMLMMS